VEQLLILTLALGCGLGGLAVHFFWYPSVVLMSVLLGLMASEFRGRRGGSVISEVATTVMMEARGLGENITTPATTKDGDSSATPPST
jgi:hypothetical protein